MKIAVVGNAAAGKTYLSRRLAKQFSIPLVHVDSIQFLSGMKIRPHSETIKILRDLAAGSSWVIDGYGPLDIIEERFLIADKIVFIDLPIWLHFVLASKRQIQSFWKPRPELVPGCEDARFSQTIKLFKTIWVVHKKMRPELLKIFEREHLKAKMIVVRGLREMNEVGAKIF